MKKRIIKFSLTALIFAAFTIVFFSAVSYHIDNVNTKYYVGDQQNYINIAKKMHTSKYTYLGDRNRMPIYPFIQALFYKQDMNDEGFFRQGKYINAFLAFSILVFLLFIFRKYFRLFYSINLILVLTFTVFIFKAGYFQCEVLYYFLSFLSFLAILYLLINPDWKKALACGVITGIAYLAKASALPALLLFLVFVIVKFLILLFLRLLHKSSISYKDNFLKNLSCLLLVSIAFLLTVHFYISDNKQIFGRYFYNVNSTFYFWYDSWGEAEEGTRSYGDTNGWPDMPPDQIPSMQKYFQEHSIEEIFKRVISGVIIVLKKAYRSHGWFKYCYIYLSAFFLIFVLNFNKVKKDFRKYFYVVSYVFAYFISYMLLYGWYAPVSRANWPLIYGDRLILSGFIPFLFVVSIFITRYSKGIFLSYGEDKKVSFITIFNVLILYLIVPDSLLLIKKSITMFAGK